jgi:hypothetical protein
MEDPVFVVDEDRGVPFFEVVEWDLAKCVGDVNAE